MKDVIDNKALVKVNHTIGCQVIYIIIALLMASCGVIYMIYVDDNNWYRYLWAPLMIIIALYYVYSMVYKLIKERLHKIPALMITDKSLIVSRKKEEYNEIPFDVIEKFRRDRVRTGRRSFTTYIDIIYKEDAPESNSKYEKIDRIDCSGLTMRSDKLLKLLRERLSNHNGEQ